MNTRQGVWQRNGIWYVTFRYVDQNGAHQRFKRSTGPKVITREEALAVRARWKTQADALGYVADLVTAEPVFDNQREEKYPFSGFSRKFLDDYARAFNKPSEVRGKESVIRVHLAPHFGHQDIRTIKREQVYRLIAVKKAAGLSEKTINNIVGTLSKMLNVAVEWEYLDRNPMQGMHKLKEPPARVDFYTETEMVAFLDACQEVRPDWRPFFLTAFLTGMRLGELLGLKWDDVDFVRGVIVVSRNLVHGHWGTPKSGKSREIPMHPLLAATLKSYRHLKGDIVFSLPDGEPLTRNTMRKPFMRAVRKAGLRTIRFHEMRHSFASQLVIKGVSLKAVQELLGHADIRQTMIYAHLSPNVHQEAVAQLMGGSLGEAGKEVCTETL